jgi:hypothetical protein
VTAIFKKADDNLLEFFAVPNKNRKKFFLRYHQGELEQKNRIPFGLIIMKDEARRHSVASAFKIKIKYKKMLADFKNANLSLCHNKQ